MGPTDLGLPEPPLSVRYGLRKENLRCLVESFESPELRIRSIETR